MRLKTKLGTLHSFIRSFNHPFIHSIHIFQILTMCQVADGLDDETAVMFEEKCFCLLGPGEEIFSAEVMCSLGSASESPKVDRNGWSYK